MSAGDLALALDALNAIPPDLTRDQWVLAGMGAHAAGLGFEDFDAWSSGAASYRADSARAVWRSFKPGPVRAGTLYAIAKAFGWERGGRRHAPAARPARPQVAVEPAEPVERKLLSAAELARWDTHSPISGAGLAYLKARQCVVPPADGALRYQPAMRHWPTGYVGPALVALVTDAETADPLTMHFTWIRSDGTKADIERPRLLLGGHRKAGGVIRLWPDEAVTYSLAVADAKTEAKRHCVGLLLADGWLYEAGIPSGWRATNNKRQTWLVPLDAHERDAFRASGALPDFKLTPPPSIAVPIAEATGRAGK